MKLSGIVCRYGFIVRDGVLGVTSGAIYHLWQMVADYDDLISQGINYWSWIQIKRVKKSATTM